MTPPPVPVLTKEEVYGMHASPCPAGAIDTVLCLRNQVLAVQASHEALRSTLDRLERQKLSWFERMKVAENQTDDLRVELAVVRAKCVELVKSAEAERDAARSRLAQVEQELNMLRLRETPTHLGEMAGCYVARLSTISPRLIWVCHDCDATKYNPHRDGCVYQEPTDAR